MYKYQCNYRFIFILSGDLDIDNCTPNKELTQNTFTFDRNTIIVLLLVIKMAATLLAYIKFSRSISCSTLFPYFIILILEGHTFIIVITIMESIKIIINN